MTEEVGASLALLATPEEAASVLLVEGPQEAASTLAEAGGLQEVGKGNGLAYRRREKRH